MYAVNSTRGNNYAPTSNVKFLNADNPVYYQPLKLLKPLVKDKPDEKKENKNKNKNTNK